MKDTAGADTRPFRLREEQRQPSRAQRWKHSSAPRLRSGRATVTGRLGERLFPGFSKGNSVIERERVPAGMMAGDQDASRTLDHCHLPERGFCVIEQVVKLITCGDEDFQLLDGLTTHDKQLLCEAGHYISESLT